MVSYKTITKQVAGFNVLKGFDFVMLTGLMIVLTRFLTKEDYGIYSILSISIMLVMGIGSLGLPTYLERSLSGVDAKKAKSDFGKLLGFMKVYTPLLFIALSLCALLFLYFTKNNAYILPTLFVIGIAVAGIFLNVIAGWYRSRQKIISAKIIETVFDSFWAIPIFALSIFGTMSLLGVFGTRLAYTALIFLVIIWFGLKLRYQKWDKTFIKNALIFGIPLASIIVSRWAITSLDRYILVFFHGAVEVANYSYIYSLLALLGLIAGNIGVTLGPYMFGAYNMNKKSKSKFLFNAMLKYEWALIIPLTIGFFILSKEAVTLVSGLRYLDALSLVPFLLLFPLFERTFSVYVSALLLKDKTIKIGLIFGLAVLLNTGLNFLLIPFWKGIGAALATTITYFLLCLVFYLRARKKFAIDHSYVRLPRIIISAVIMGLIISFINPLNVFTKVLTVIAGAVIYGACLLITKAYVPEEITLIKSFLKKQK